MDNAPESLIMALEILNTKYPSHGFKKKDGSILCKQFNIYPPYTLAKSIFKMMGYNYHLGKDVKENAQQISDIIVECMQNILRTQELKTHFIKYVEDVK